VTAAAAAAAAAAPSRIGHQSFWPEHSDVRILTAVVRKPNGDCTCINNKHAVIFMLCAFLSTLFGSFQFRIFSLRLASS